MAVRRMATLAGVAIVIAVAAGAARGADPVPLRVRVFPGVQNLPLFAGQARGLFVKHGVRVDLQFTPNSQALREGLAAGAFEVAHAAADNAVAMVTQVNYQR
jgi:ABC-type nitrate/sulfonate/bicarbonate transport system substrate-binding protein